MLLLLGVVLLAPSINYATPNQNASDNFTNTTNVSQIVENTTNSTIIQNTTTKVVNDTNTSQKLNQTSTSSNYTQNNSSECSNGTTTIQNNSAAASDGYQNVHGLWISADEASSVNLTEILNAGITDIFVKCNRFSSPNYDTVLTSIISKFQGTGIRIHAWVTCFIDENGNWVDPLGKNTTYTVQVPYTETVKVATQNWYKDWYQSYYKVWYKSWYKNWYKYRGSWYYNWKYYWNYYWGSSWQYTWKYYTTYTYETRTSYKTETRTVMSTTFNDALVNYIATIAKNYNIDGVHLDYVRYPGTAYLHPGGTEAITNFVKKVDETLYSISPKIALSAALMPECSVNGYYYGQDYAALSPYLDFLVPMIYKGNYKEDTAWIGTTTKWISTHSTKPVVAGLQTYGSDSNVKKLSSAELIQDINSAISNGSSGYVLFRYGLVDKAFFNQSSSIPSTNSTNGTNVSTQTTFTIAQIIDASSRVKAYVESNKALPNFVTIGSVQVSMSEFLRLLSAGVLQVSNGNNAPIALKNVSTASNPSEDMKSGNLNKTEYLDLASRIKSFMDTNGLAPNFGSTTLGKIQYQSLVYLFSRVLAFYGTENYLPNYATMAPWNSIATSTNSTNSSNNNQTGTNVSTQTTFTIAQIIDASSRVKAYVESNKALPNFVTIGSVQVSMSEFLRLLSAGVLQVSNGNNAPIVLKSISAASNPSEEMTSGNLDKNGYIDLANRIKSFMDTNGLAPNFGSTTLGKIRYESLIYLYSRIMAFYGTEKYLPNYAVMKPWSTITGSGSSTTDPSIPSSLQVYLQATANCQVNDPSIIAMAKSITSGATSSYDKAQRIFNWVRDNLEYSMYYDTKYGAVKTLQNRVGNCVDHSHLIVALSRAAGLPARYVHGVCTFTSGNTYGHVFAQIYVNGQWYNADATSYKNELGVIRNWNTNTWTYKGTYAELPF